MALAMDHLYLSYKSKNGLTNPIQNNRPQFYSCAVTDGQDMYIVQLYIVHTKENGARERFACNSTIFAGKWLIRLSFIVFTKTLISIKNI